MGIFNKGNCAYCEKNCNLFNYKKLRDGVVCSKCAEKLENEGLIFSENDLLNLTEKTLLDRISRNNSDLTDLPIITNPNIVLKKGEICYYEGDAYSYKMKNIITHYERHGASSGIKIAKGISIGRSSGVSIPVRENIVEKYPAKFYITNKRIILTADKYGFELSVNKITSLKNYSNAFDYYCGEKTYTVLTNDVKYIIRLCKLISQTSQDVQT